MKIRKAISTLKQLGIGHGLPDQPSEEYFIAEEAQLELEKLLVEPTNHMDVLAFYNKFGIPIQEEPALLDRETLRFRTARMVEELAEFCAAHGAGDLEEAADALIDLAYILHGTAISMGIPWGLCWKEVHNANMRKELAADATQSRHRFKMDIIKPEGWVAPNLKPYLKICPSCGNKGFDLDENGRCGWCS